MSETPTAAPSGSTPHNPRGGAREARNTDLYCPAEVPENDDGKCHNYRAKDGRGGHLEKCIRHGSGTPQSRAKVARGTIASVAEKQGIVLPDVAPKDFPKIAAEVISWNLAQFAALGSELEKLRLMHDPVAHARQYSDIFGLLDQMGRTIATLTKAAAALPPAPEEPVEAPAKERIMEALEGILDRMNSGDTCAACGQPMPTPGTAVEPSDAPPDGSDAPVATLLPLAPGAGSDGAVVVSPEGGLL